MGIIQKQSIKGLIYTYLGVIIGFITTGYLMPKYLQQSEIGLLRVLVSYSTLLAQFSSLGFSIVILRIFPYFRDPTTKNHGFFGLFSIIAAIGFTISLLIFYFYYQFYIKTDIPDLLDEYIIWITPLTLFILLFILSDSYIRALYDAVSGAITKELIQRVFILIVILLFVYKIFTFDNFVIGYILAFSAPPIILFYQLIQRKSIGLIPDFKFLNKDLRKKVIGVSIFGLATSFSGILILNIDILMVERYLGLTLTGIYSISFFFGTLVLIPSRPLTRISAIIVAESFKNNDLKNINLIYKKSSINLLTIGLLLFLGIAINMESIFSLIGNDYRPGYYVILIIAFSNVIQMSSGILNQVVFNSKYYKYSTYFMFSFALIIVLSNSILIPYYGITGAAIATLISKSIYEFSRVIFVRVKLKLNPYQFKTLIPVLITGILYWLQTFLPPLDNYVIDIVLRSGIVSIFFILFVYFFNVSNDINIIIDNQIKRFTKGRNNIS